MRIKALIVKGMIENQLDALTMAGLLCISISTWYRKLNNPNTFTLLELRQMSKRFNWNENELKILIGGV